MKILCTNNALAVRAGSESYLETVVPALRQLGHDVELYSPRCGAVAGHLRGQGFRVHDDPSALGTDFDVIHGQHVNAIASIRPRLPDTPLVFATHSWFIPIEDPVAELGVAAVVTFNDITLARARAHAAVGDRPVHRLRQPVAISLGDGARTPVPTRPRVALAASRNLHGRLPGIRAACESNDIQLRVVGPGGDESPDARREIRAADIVIAIGRTAVEAMAAGRAVLVLDESTVGGWLTEDSYGRLEADGFTGFAGNGDRTPLPELVARYRPDLGAAARVLAVRHHSAQRHAVELVDIYRQAMARPPAQVRLDPQLASLTDAALALEARALRAEWALAGAQRAALVAERDRDAARAELETVRGQFESAREQVEQIVGSRSWRVLSGARRVGGAARGLVARGGPAGPLGDLGAPASGQVGGAGRCIADSSDPAALQRG